MCPQNGISSSVISPAPAHAGSFSSSALSRSRSVSREPKRTISRATISVRYFLSPLFRSSQLEVCSLPSIYIFAPLWTYSPTISAKRCQARTLCHSVRSCHSPELSLNFSVVARLNLAKATPLGALLHLGVLADTSDQDHFVDAFRHVCLLKLHFCCAGSRLAQNRAAMPVEQPRQYFSIVGGVNGIARQC